MDPMSPFTVTPVLRQVVERRIEELECAKENFERRYLSPVDRTQEPSIVKRISSLLKDVQNLELQLTEDDEWMVDTINRCTEQAPDDKTLSNFVSMKKLLKFEQNMRKQIEKHTNRLEVSRLHTRLLKEALTTNNPINSAANVELEKLALDDDFELIGDTVTEVHENIASNIARPTDVNPEAITNYLRSLFEGNEHVDFQDVRDIMQVHGAELLDSGMWISEGDLKCAITDLMGKEFIDISTKEILSHYSQSPVAMRELVATMKMKSFNDWEYKHAESGLSVKTYRSADGQSHFVVEEDIIDMIFLHHCAQNWGSRMRQGLRLFMDSSTSFCPPPMTESESKTHEFFVNFIPMSYDGFLSVRKGGKPNRRRMYTGREAYRHLFEPQTLANERYNNYKQHFFMSRLPTDLPGTSEEIIAQEVQAKLLQTLATECRIQEALGQSFRVSATKFVSLASTIPHDTILTVLKYLGVPEVFLNFFERFLKVKLRINPSSRDKKPLERSFGVSFGHSLELFFSEAVLFFLELAVRKETGTYFYRLYDRCYFIDTPEITKKAEKALARFCDIMGLKSSDTCGTGNPSIGFLNFNLQPSTCPKPTTAFEIDQVKVADYANQVKKRLGNCSSVLEWVRKWNDTVGNYAAHLFGSPTDTFGEKHHDAVMAAYNFIYSTILDDGDLTTHVANLLKPHTELAKYRHDIEPIIHLPQAFGGLGVKSPFFTLILAVNTQEPISIQLQEYHSLEDEYYRKKLAEYLRRSPLEQKMKAQAILKDDQSEITSVFGLPPCSNLEPAMIPFMTKEELFKHRDRTSYGETNLDSGWNSPSVELACLHRQLIEKSVNRVDGSLKVTRNLGQLDGKGWRRSWSRMRSEDQWVMQMYSDDCFERYGTLDIWWSDGVPVEVYNEVRGYQWDYDDDHDGSSNMTDER
ncbi:hypothetical protein Ptr902_00933 [Pyrenophora tritici-repentis]|nr:hypothetical protein Ptr902_00933 [Pyrenophora tritici-repentis]